MPTGSEPQPGQFGDWVLQYRPPSQPGPSRLVVLIHGWTGNEKVMWIFAQRLPSNCWVLAPRGPVQAPQGGYGWIQADQGVSASIQVYQPPAEELSRLVQDWPRSLGFQPEQTSLMGFSQGAAVTYTLALLHPQLIDSIAALAGFVPPGAEAFIKNRSLVGKRVLIAHGLRDETVPVQRAYEAAKLMQAAGAQVTYCESDVGHKLGANCLHGIESFFASGNLAE